MWIKSSPSIACTILEIIQERVIVRAWVRARYTQCARALCYYILSVVPDAGAGPCHWLLLVSYSGAMYFWSTSRAPHCCTSFSLEKKEGLRKGREAEFVTGDTAKKAACHGYVKKESLHFTESITAHSVAVIVNVSRDYNMSNSYFVVYRISVLYQ